MISSVTPGSVPTAVDLFSGAGGLSEGLRQAGFQILAASDHDPDAAATYRLNFPEVAMVQGDLTDRVNHATLADLAAPMNRDLDLLAGGPPCQAFSQVRNHDRLLEDPRNRLYREFVDVLDELRPRALLLENVPGLLQFNAGKVREQIETDLSLGGIYEVQSRLLDAGDFGTPQSRSRLVFVGVRRGEAFPDWPVGTGVTGEVRLRRKSVRGNVRYELGGPEELIDRLLDPADSAAVTAEQALSDLARPGINYASESRSAFQAAMRSASEAPQDHSPSRIREDTVLRLKGIPPGGNVYDLPAELAGRYLTGKKWGPAGNGKRLARRHFYAYRRLHPEWLAWTANTKADFAYHYRQARGLSVREVARIQGFPDRFHTTTAPRGTPGQLYGGARHSRYRQIGNAVPPPLAAAIGREMMKVLTLQAAECVDEPLLRAA